MLFNSWDFWACFLPLWGLYWLLRRRGQNYLLLAFSTAFYGYWDWRFLALLWWSTIDDYHCALRIHNSSDPAVKRRYMALSLATNLGILCLFKYFDFFLDTLAPVLSRLGVDLPPHVLALVVPVGLSFYTFQTLGYTLDVYRGRCAPVASFPDFVLFVSFFPQLVAGPIEKASSLVPQIRSERSLDRAGFARGVWLCLWGLFQKCVVADNLAKIVDPVFAAGARPAAAPALLASYAFTFQIYCDFSGYSDIARGLAALLGFRLSVNFRLPLFSVSPADFWRRWHITLSAWFRDHVYEPLNRGRESRPWTRRRNRLIVLLLTGLWHGPSWNFVLFGAYWGAAAVLYDLARPSRRGSPRGGLVARALFFHVCVVSLLIFRAPSPGVVWDLFASGGRPWAPAPVHDLRLFLVVLLPLLLVELLRWPDRDAESILERPAALKAPLFLALVLGLLWLSPPRTKEYIYFQF